MDLYRPDELMPVWNHHDDDEFYNGSNDFDNFWPITGATSDEDNSASSDAMFVDSGSSDDHHAHYTQDNYFSTHGEAFSSSSEDFAAQHVQYNQQQDHQHHQHHQQPQLEHHQQLGYPNQQPQILPHQQPLQYHQFVNMGYPYSLQPQYYVDPNAYSQVPVKTEESHQSAPLDMHLQPLQDITSSHNTNTPVPPTAETYEEDVQYDDEEDDQYDPQNEDQQENGDAAVNYTTTNAAVAPSSPSSEGAIGTMDVDSDPVDFKLPASKTPIMEAMVVCALNGWGLTVVKSFPNEVVFRVTDFDRYYRVSRAICSKHRPTEDIGSRVKSLRRWFVNFPKKKDRQENPSFLLAVKPNTCRKVHGLIERNIKLMSGSKRSSR